MTDEPTHGSSILVERANEPLGGVIERALTE